MLFQFAMYFFVFLNKNNFCSIFSHEYMTLLQPALYL